MVSEGQFVGLDWNRIARLHSQVLVSTCENSLTASRCHIKAYQDAAIKLSRYISLLNICTPWSLLNLYIMCLVDWNRNDCKRTCVLKLDEMKGG